MFDDLHSSYALPSLPPLTALREVFSYILDNGLWSGSSKNEYEIYTTNKYLLNGFRFIDPKKPVKRTPKTKNDLLWNEIEQMKIQCRQRNIPVQLLPLDKRNRHEMKLICDFIQNTPVM